MIHKQQEKNRYDICIIGGGPAGLATLSAIQEPYSMDVMNNTQVSNANLSMRCQGRCGMGPSRKKICIVDPSGKWLGKWTDNFER